MSNTKQLLPSDIGCIDLKWLEAEIKSLEAFTCRNEREKGYLFGLRSIKSQLFPIKPIMEDAWGNGSNFNYGFKSSQDTNSSYLNAKQSYLTQPITINTKENG